MTGIHRAWRTTRLGLVQLALLAMVLRALIPAGWMPAQAGQGTGLVICTGQGLVTIQVGPDGKPLPAHPGDQDQTHHHDVCPFAAAAHLAPPAIVAALGAPSALAMGNAQRIPPALYRGLARHSLASPRAPPRLV